MKKRGNIKNIIIFTAIILVFLILSYIFYLNTSSILGYDLKNNPVQEPTTTCGDGTKNFECSKTLPYFCENGQLIEYASTCKCEKNTTQEGEKCIYEYQKNPKTITLDYIIRGEENKINLNVYEDLVIYIENLPKNIFSRGEDKSIRWDFKKRNINDIYQQNLLKELVIKIQNLAENKDDQARIAISLVQNIPYEESEKTVFFNDEDTGALYSRYPYEVLYDEKGICQEKSELLGFLLKELGFGFKIYYYQQENHEAIGIKCPEEYSNEKDGYCFIETTGISIVTNYQNTYQNIAGGILQSIPETIYQKDGETFGENDMYEYDDAKKWMKIEKQLNEKQFINIFNKKLRDSLILKYGIQN